MMTIAAKTLTAFDPIASLRLVLWWMKRHEKNLKLIRYNRTGAGIIALKAFFMYRLAPLICRYLSGTCASVVHEARLGFEEFQGPSSEQIQRGQKRSHTFSAAYTEADFKEILYISDHVVLNSSINTNAFCRSSTSTV